ncbi:hypothetical protein [Paenibacillus sp.]|uniref:hypothetical protein n=1 Tax=Paenibacillus sp. TaxID=58172 RepID=UPI0025DCFCC9|nr:hypothetical protein [Paenibacillus sp.]
MMFSSCSASISCSVERSSAHDAQYPKQQIDDLLSWDSEIRNLPANSVLIDSAVAIIIPWIE